MAFFPEQETSTSVQAQMIVWGFLKDLKKVKEYNDEFYVDPLVLTICSSYYSAIFLDSNILKKVSDKNYLLLLDAIRTRMDSLFETELLYRNNRDGTLVFTFHDLCDCTGCPTLTIIESNFGHIFGGYTSLSWQSTGGFKEDKSAFLFLLKSNFEEAKPGIIGLKQNGKYAVCHDVSHYGPMFGAGAIAIMNEEGHSFINNAYVDGKVHGNGLCGGKVYNDEDRREYKFLVKEYEVFALNEICQ